MHNRNKRYLLGGGGKYTQWYTRGAALNVNTITTYISITIFFFLMYVLTFLYKILMNAPMVPVTRTRNVRIRTAHSAVLVAVATEGTDLNAKVYCHCQNKTHLCCFQTMLENYHTNNAVDVMFF